MRENLVLINRDIYYLLAEISLSRSAREEARETRSRVALALFCSFFFLFELEKFRCSGGLDEVNEPVTRSPRKEE